MMLYFVVTLDANTHIYDEQEVLLVAALLNYTTFIFNISYIYKYIVWMPNQKDQTAIVREMSDEIMTNCIIAANR